MSPQTKLALRRFTLRWLRYFLDWCDERLHAAEVRLREDLSNWQSHRGLVNAKQFAPEGTPLHPCWQRVAKEPPAAAPRSGVGNPACPVREKVSTNAAASHSRIAGPASPGHASPTAPERYVHGVIAVTAAAPSARRKRRGISARAFDLRFSTR